MANAQTVDLEITDPTGELIPAHWGRDFLKEYLPASAFAAFMGDNASAVIRTKKSSAEAGQETWIPLVKFSGEGTWVENNATLSGNEDEVESFGHKVMMTLRRTANAATDYDANLSVIDLLKASREDLRRKASIKLRNDIQRQLTAVGVFNAPAGAGYKGFNTPVPYATATAAQKNAWQTANNDRILFGHERANLVAGNHAASLANVGPTDVLTLEVVEHLIRVAQETHKTGDDRWAIAPTSAKGHDEETYVMFVNPRAWRDLRKDPGFRDAYAHGWERGANNPLFKRGDLYYQGVIVRSVLEMPLLLGAGASNLDVGHCVFLGAQALTAPWSKTPTPIKEVRDYGHITGVGVKEVRGVSKMFAKAVQTGIIDVFLAASPDA